jgi:hypothetical protein
MKLGTSEAQLEELEKEINVEDAEQEENEINRNANNECLDVIQAPEIIISNVALLQDTASASDDDLTSPVDFESVSLGPSLLQHADYNSPQPMMIETASIQVGAQSQIQSRPIYLNIPSHQIEPMQPLLSQTSVAYDNLPPPPLYSELSPRTLSHSTQGYPGPPPSFSPIGAQWRWVGGWVGWLECCRATSRY